MGEFIDLLNKQFGRWTVIKPADNIGQFTAWLCFCDCGTTRVVNGQSLRTGKSNSCGCLKNEELMSRSTKHNCTGTRVYRIWKGMRNRCNNPNSDDFHNYGGRGISICEDWSDFSIFQEWTLNNGYSEFLTIDRIDNNGNYGADNCRWVSRGVQAFNTRVNRIVETWLGDMPITQLARVVGINRKILARRLDLGFSEDELLEPIKQNKGVEKGEFYYCNCK